MHVQQAHNICVYHSLRKIVLTFYCFSLNQHNKIFNNLNKIIFSLFKNQNLFIISLFQKIKIKKKSITFQNPSQTFKKKKNSFNTYTSKEQFQLKTFLSNKQGSLPDRES